jgi:hypothetical protein
MQYSAKAPLRPMTRYTDETNTGAPMVPIKTDDSTPSTLEIETLEETVFSHRL